MICSALLSFWRQLLTSLSLSLSLCFPTGYERAFLANKLDIPLDKAKKQLVALVAVAKANKAQYFGVVRKESLYPINEMAFEVAVAK
jgi:hypothetical protein